MQATLTLPCGLRIGPRGPNPGDPISADYWHYEWYVPIDETHHRYIIAWGRKVASAEEPLQVEHDVRTRWSYLEYEGFHASDVTANEAFQPSMWQRLCHSSEVAPGEITECLLADGAKAIAVRDSDGNVESTRESVRTRGAHLPRVISTTTC